MYSKSRPIVRLSSAPDSCFISELRAATAVAEPLGRSTRMSIRSPAYSKPIKVARGVSGATRFPPSIAMTVMGACPRENENPAEALSMRSAPKVSQILIGQSCCQET